MVKVQQFFTELGIQDTHHVFNSILLSLIDNTCKIGSRPIDTIAILLGIIECIEGCTLETDKIVLSDHQSYIIDIDFGWYF